MPKYGIEEEDRPPSNVACSGLREDLKECLLKSDCVRLDKNTPLECLRQGHDAKVPSECHALRVAFFECKRSVLDMRTRFRGRKGY
ncbi:cytochrome c oxidase assembly factor 5-like [Lineus longissimus]|uniref:cytochrome c oxidase assembly factor 5-like n=1 Tax=Lineus longissimus TaxID=88925 RepID=UPI00315C956D